MRRTDTWATLPSPMNQNGQGQGLGACLLTNYLSQEDLSVRNPAFLKASQKSGAKQRVADNRPGVLGPLIPRTPQDGPSSFGSGIPAS